MGDQKEMKTPPQKKKKPVKPEYLFTSFDEVQTVVEKYCIGLRKVYEVSVIS